MMTKHLIIATALITTGAVVLSFATDMGTAIGVHLLVGGWAWFVVKYPKEETWPESSGSKG